MLNEVGAFTPEESARLLHDADASAAGLAAIRAIQDDEATPLVPFTGEGGLRRKAAFAVSVQGLAPRLAALPDVGLLGEAFRRHLDGEAERCAARGRRILGVLSRLGELLRSAGVRAVPLKGAALLLRGEIPSGLRPMADVDLLFDSESDLREAAGRIGAAMEYEPLWNTRRHLVLAERKERVALWACEHPENPLRIELHRSFRIEVLGTVLDATDSLRRETESLDGWEVPSREPLLDHLLYHAAEDFAAKGLRGVQAVDFLVLARKYGPLPIHDVREECRGPVVLAAQALERLFPGAFDAQAIARAAETVRSGVLLRGASLPVLRHSRPERGWTFTSLDLIDGNAQKVRFLLRTVLPSLDEVRANVAPTATGGTLASAWAGVLMQRLASAARRLGRG